MKVNIDKIIEKDGIRLEKATMGVLINVLNDRFVNKDISILKSIFQANELFKKRKINNIDTIIEVEYLNLVILIIETTDDINNIYIYVTILDKNNPEVLFNYTSPYYDCYHNDLILFIRKVSLIGVSTLKRQFSIYNNSLKNILVNGNIINDMNKKHYSYYEKNVEEK